MQPIHLKLENFGPYEDSLIDFSSFYTQSLFLITGKTGAGKTTIFDGMCYALYGVTSGGLRQGKEMRSNFSEVGKPTRVTFTFKRDDHTYVIVREPAQLAKKLRGEGLREKPAEVTLTIYDGEQQEIQQFTKEKDVGPFLSELLQLNAQQFSQIVMLPQGEFRRFLNADSDSKEKVLRKLFNTYFYQQLAEHLKNKKKEQESALKNVKQELGVLANQLEWETPFTEKVKDFTYYQDVLSLYHEQENQYLESIKTEEQVLKKINKQLETQQKKIQEEEKWVVSFKELKQVEDKQQQLINKKTDIENLRGQLLLLQKIEKIQPTYLKVAELDQERQKVKRTIASLKLEEEQLTRELALLKVEEEALSKEETVMTSLKSDLVEMAKSFPLVKESHELDLKQKKIQQEILQLKKEELKKQEELDKLTLRLSRLEASIKLESQLIEEQFTVLKAIETLEKQVEVVAEYEAQSQLLKDKQENFKAVKERLKMNECAVESCQLNYKQQKSDWAKAQIAKLSLDLVEGEACPVCGALEHPQPFHGELMGKEELLALEGALEVSEEKLNDAQKEYQSSLKDHEYLAESLVELEKNVVDLAVTIQSFFETELPSNEWQKDLVNKRKQSTEKLEETTTQLEQIVQEKKLLEKGQQDRLILEESLKVEEELLRQKENESLQLSTSYGNILKRLPDEWQSLETLEVLQKETTQKVSLWEQRVEVTNQKINHLNERLLVIKTTLHREEKQEIEWQKKLNVERQIMEEFLKEEEIEESVLLHSLSQLIQIPTIRQQITDFDKEDYALEKHWKELNELLQDKEYPQLEPLVEEMTQLELSQKTQSEKISRLNYVVTHNKKIVDQVVTKEASMKAELANLEELVSLTNVLTGDGSSKLSLERYVLQTYLKRILQRGNEKLVTLTNGRYRFELKEEEGSFKKKTGLEINIFDDNVGALRSVNTLSGGESFIAALSLALSLAEVIQEESGGIQIDAMFIDEGFGSLDEDALEMAIRSLESIEGEGRLIGIISHVRELKERIPQQLEVKSTLDGKSYVKERLEFE